MTQSITPEALAALALARHVRDVALHTGADINERIGPDMLDQWQEWYACALTWASGPANPADPLDYRVYAITKRITDNTWLKIADDTAPDAD